MKQITNKDIDKMLDEILKEFPLEKLLEADFNPNMPKPSVTPQRHVSKPSVERPPVAPKKIVRAPATKPIVKKKPTSQTISGPKDKKPVEKKPLYNPQQAKEKEQMSKTQYQIFNIKMRLGKLGLNDTVRRFVQSIHDFDINVTKNSKDVNDILSYLSPAQGNLIALKGALESLEAEFDELDKLLDEEK